MDNLEFYSGQTKVKVEDMNWLQTNKSDAVKQRLIDMKFDGLLEGSDPLMLDVSRDPTGNPVWEKLNVLEGIGYVKGERVEITSTLEDYDPNYKTTHPYKSSGSKGVPLALSPVPGTWYYIFIKYFQKEDPSFVSTDPLGIPHYIRKLDGYEIISQTSSILEDSLYLGKIQYNGPSTPWVVDRSGRKFVKLPESMLDVSGTKSELTGIIEKNLEYTTSEAIVSPTKLSLRPSIAGTYIYVAPFLEKDYALIAKTVVNSLSNSYILFDNTILEGIYEIYINSSGSLVRILQGATPPEKSMKLTAVKWNPSPPPGMLYNPITDNPTDQTLPDYRVFGILEGKEFRAETLKQIDILPFSLNLIDYRDGTMGGVINYFDPYDQVKKFVIEKYNDITNQWEKVTEVEI